MATMQVELVAPERRAWTGEATMVVVKTIEGELGILPGHSPVLAVLANGAVEIRPEAGETIRAAVLGGFLSVVENRVSILAEHVELSGEISEGEAESELRDAMSRSDTAAAAQARARLSAVSGRR